MKKFAVIAVMGLMSVVFASGVAYAQEAKGKTDTKTVTGIQVELTTPAEGLKVGDNSVGVRMKEAASGQAVIREVARIDLAMDEGDKSMNHGSMSMSSQKPTVFELKPVAGEQGRYEGKVTLSDPGDWNLRVFTDSRGVGSPATFKVNVGKASPGSAQTTSSSPASQSANSGLLTSVLVMGGLALAAVAIFIAVLATFRKPSRSSQGTPTQETTKA